MHLRIRRVSFNSPNSSLEHSSPRTKVWRKFEKHAPVFSSARVALIANNIIFKFVFFFLQIGSTYRYTAQVKCESRCSTNVYLDLRHVTSHEHTHTIAIIIIRWWKKLLAVDLNYNLMKFNKNEFATTYRYGYRYPKHVTIITAWIIQSKGFATIRDRRQELSSLRSNKFSTINFSRKKTV